MALDEVIKRAAHALKHSLRIAFRAPEHLLDPRLHNVLVAIALVILQDVPVLLRDNVLRTGHHLFATDIAARCSFEREVENTFADASPHLDSEADVTLHRILSHAT